LFATAAVFLVALLHVGFFVMESLRWMTPEVRAIFGTSEADAATGKVLAMNQGFYNLGAAVLLVVFHCGGQQVATVGVLAYLCAMGLVGGFTASKAILGIQSLPAALAIGLVLAG
jgi:putative membrane protein